MDFLKNIFNPYHSIHRIPSTSVNWPTENHGIIGRSDDLLHRKNKTYPDDFKKTGKLEYHT
jgi:hypothetical protein